MCGNICILPGSKCYLVIIIITISLFYVCTCLDNYLVELDEIYTQDIYNKKESLFFIPTQFKCINPLQLGKIGEKIYKVF